MVVPAFNVAHSRGVILIGLSVVGEIGVDVEYVDPGVELYDIARTAFHAKDLARIQLAATQDEGLIQFYRCWTRREAVAKADGRGLSLEPTAFAAGADTVGEHEVMLREPLPPRKFFVRGIDVGGSHLAAIAMPTRGLALHCYEFSPRSPLLFAE